MKVLTSCMIGKPYKGIEPNDRRKHNKKGAKNGKTR